MRALYKTIPAVKVICLSDISPNLCRIQNELKLGLKEN